MPRVAEIWRYPVKSVGGELLHSARLDELGVEGDRRWGVVDDHTGLVLTGRREPRLLLATARLDPDGPVVSVAADGRELRSSEDLSEWLGRPVSLTPAGEQGGTYENPVDYENDADWVAWEGPGGAWHDSHGARISIVSTGSLGSWDPRRFRANLLVEGDGEDDLVGSQLEIGGSSLLVTRPITRCVMVTRPQPGLERDLDVLRAVNRERGGTLAVGALVASPGTVAVGDVLQPD